MARNSKAEAKISGFKEKAKCGLTSLAEAVLVILKLKMVLLIVCMSPEFIYGHVKHYT